LIEKNDIAIAIMPNPSKTKDFIALGKLRLSSLVVFSAVIGYLIAVRNSSVIWLDLVYIILGGILVTASSNALNQVWERELDIKMKRTQNRPIAAGRMSASEGMVFAIATGLIGELFLFMLNPLSGILGLLALFLYVVCYTPLKQISPIAVFVGAFPGSIPPMLGYIAATGKFDWIAGVLFLTQFFWQFPHFWAIAWRINDDYELAGFKMLPTRAGKTKSNAFQIFTYTALMIPIGILPCIDVFGSGLIVCNPYAVFILAPLGVYFAYPAYKLYTTMDDIYAKKLMFASFFYLPIAQLTYLFFNT
jgi:protoheme IX farnesyltransferase